jgi:hypothetical protein
MRCLGKAGIVIWEKDELGVFLRRREALVPFKLGCLMEEL